MFRNWSLRVVAATVAVCLTVSAVWVSPVGAMIFPDLLSLVRVDSDRDTEDKSIGDESSGRQQQTEEQPKADVVEETYIVKQGDTLWDLSRKFSVDWKKIAYVNNLSLNGVICPGQELTIPLVKGSFHIVQRGENLWEIARKYETNVADVVAANKIANPNQLRVGARLTIPGTKAVPASTSQRKTLSSRYEGYWHWPIKGVITSCYGARRSEFHHGLDVAADKGERVYPIRGGIVEFSGYLNRIYGRAVIVDHGDGIRSLYAHNSQNLVEQGDRIKISTPIAKIGSSGKSTGPHMHLEVYVDGETIDPQKLLD